MQQQHQQQTADKKNTNSSIEYPEGGVHDEQDRALLWSEFLRMMQTKQPDLTLPALKEAVENEHNNLSTATTSTNDEQPDTTKSGAITSASNDDNMYDDLPIRKRPRLQNNNNSGIKEENVPSATGMELSEETARTYVVVCMVGVGGV